MRAIAKCAYAIPKGYKGRRKIVSLGDLKKSPIMGTDTHTHTHK